MRRGPGAAEVRGRRHRHGAVHPEFLSRHQRLSFRSEIALYRDEVQAVVNAGREVLVAVAVVGRPGAGRQPRGLRFAPRRTAVLRGRGGDGQHRIAHEGDRDACGIGGGYRDARVRLGVVRIRVAVAQLSAVAIEGRHPRADADGIADHQSDGLPRVDALRHGVCGLFGPRVATGQKCSRKEADTDNPRVHYLVLRNGGLPNGPAAPKNV